MARSVTVKLTADAGEYIVSVKEAKKATGDLDDKVQATNRDIDKLPPAAARAAAAMKLLNSDVTTGTKSLDQINIKLKDTEKALKAAAAEFNKTGSATSLQQVVQLSADKKALQKLQNDVTTSLEGAGKDGGIGLMRGLLYGAAAVAPIVLPAVGGLILAGLGLSVIGAGIVGQLGSQQVKNAFANFKDDAGQVFRDATAPFGGVITRELSAADDLLHKVSPTLTEMFAKTAPAADHFFAGINGFVEQSLPGLNKGLDGAMVVINELGRDLPAVGQAIGNAFANAAVGAEGDAKALHDLLFVIDQLISASGAAAGASGQLYNMLRDIATLNFDDLKKSNISLTDVVLTLITGGIYPAAKGLYHWATGADKAKESTDEAAKSANELKINMEVAGASLDLAGGKAMSASDQFGSLISQLNAVNNTADKVAGAAVDRIINPMLQADMAANNFNKSLITLGDTLVANGGQLSAHVNQLKKSETGQQQNKDAILAVVQANLQEYDSQIAVGVAASDAAAKYDENTKALEDQLRAAGYTSKQIDDLIGKYRNVPDKVDTSIAINGLTDAINDLDQLLRQINGLHDKTITINEHVYTYQDASNTYHGYALGGIRRAQVGMLIPPSSPGTVLTAEPQTGGEALIPLRGISQMRAAALGQVAMGGYGLDVVPRGYRSVMSSGSGSINVTVSAAPGGSDLDRAMASWFMGAVRKGDIQITAKAN